MAREDIYTEFKNYKFNDLRVYSSTEWLAGNKKKYRQVFDRYDTSYIYAELSVVNKLYDRELWEMDVELKCFQIAPKKRAICHLEFTRKISKFDSIAYIREGWGNKNEGAFWRRGTYYWEAWIDGEKVGTKYFNIEDAGRAIEGPNNAYLELTGVRLYEGDYEESRLEEERHYYKSFSAEETRYIFVEALFKNNNRAHSWQCELYAKFYNQARELKGEVVRLQKVKKGAESIEVHAGWGSNIKGTWARGRYTVDLVFMEQHLATVAFEVGEDFEEGGCKVLLPNGGVTEFSPDLPDSDLSFEELMAKLDRLIGLQSIKKRLRDHAQYIQFVRLRKARGFVEGEPFNVHSVFTGNPGTGKTTVAKMLGLLYLKMGLLSKGHVHEVDRVDLVGEYIGQTAPKVKEAIEKARGGVLFVDEAYALARTNDDSKDFGREVIEMLVKEMSEGPGDLVLVVAGYPKEMQHFLDSNPGLKSRFKLHYHFADYLPNELHQIAQYACEQYEVKLSDDASEYINHMITEAYRSRDRSFGNARFVFDLIEKAKINLGIRIMQSDTDNVDDDTLALITRSDVEKIKSDKKNILPNIPIDEALLEKSLEALDRLVGLTKVKSEIKELVRLVRFQKKQSQQVLHSFFLHTVLVGNPGTGKTTVARILTKIYKALGILERGHMVETDRRGLVAGFVGQTAIKTSKKIDEAEGGVLFIDEAYALTTSKFGFNDYGDEAIQTLLKRMEDQRGSFFVFVAGYPENMDKFLKTNPGFSSRFDRLLVFDDYSPDELLEIAHRMCEDAQVKLSSKASAHLLELFTKMHRRRDKYFGNARAVRNLIDQAIRNMHLRMSERVDQGKQVSKYSISFQDVQVLDKVDSTKVFVKPRIGYGARD